MPYDPPSQAAWNTSKNFTDIRRSIVSPKVKAFQGYGMGSYSFFNQGVDIPQRPHSRSRRGQASNSTAC